MSWLSHEIHQLEADGIRFVANGVLAPNEPKIAALLGGEVPVGAGALIALVEKDDAALGPVISALINETITSYQPAIEAELEALAGGSGTVIGQLVAAMNAFADKLAAS